MTYRKYQKRKKENELSGSGACVPEDTFLYEAEMSFLLREDELNKGLIQLHSMR